MGKGVALNLTVKLCNAGYTKKQKWHLEEIKYYLPLNDIFQPALFWAISKINRQGIVKQNASVA